MPLIDTSQFRLGLTPGPKRFGTPRLSNIAAISDAPASFDHTKGFDEFKIMGNGPDPTLTILDGQPKGDCGPCMTVNASLVDALETSEPFTQPSSNEVVGWYWKFDHEQDLGVSNPKLFAHWQKYGLPWGSKLVTDADVPVDFDEAMAAGNAFGCLALAIVVWKDMMAETQRGEPWSWTPRTDTSPMGGHDTLLIAKLDGDTGELVTWGMRQKFTRAWFEHAVQEPTALLTHSQLERKSNGYGIDVPKLESYVKALEAAA